METLAEYITGKSNLPATASVEPKVDDGSLDILRAGEVASLLDVHPATVYRWLRQGSLRGFRIGKIVRIRRVDLAEFIQANLSAQL